MSYIEPGLLLSLILIGLGLRRRLFGFLGLAALLVWAFPPAATLHSWTLEGQYPARNIPVGDAEAIVVLSGGLYDVRPTQPQALGNDSTYRRAMHAAWLYNNWKPLPLLVVGGAIAQGPTPQVVSDAMAGILRSQGVQEEMIWQERTSLNTHQNAVRAAANLHEKGIRKIALVTDGRHMLRAELSFRKAGFDVVAAPCCFASVGSLDRWTKFVPSSNAIEENEACLHEWLGLAWYWLRGRI